MSSLTDLDICVLTYSSSELCLDKFRIAVHMCKGALATGWDKPVPPLSTSGTCMHVFLLNFTHYFHVRNIVYFTEWDYLNLCSDFAVVNITVAAKNNVYLFMFF